MRLTLRLLALGAVAGMLGLLIWRVVHHDDTAAAALARGEHPVAPGFTLPRLDRDGELALSSLRGRVVLLNFWASWCVPCKEEAPVLEAGWRRWRGRGVVFLGVDAQDFTGSAKRFMRRYRLTYTMVRDGSDSVYDDYGVSGFPETFFVAKDGRLVVEHVEGPLTRPQLDRDLRAALES